MQSRRVSRLWIKYPPPDAAVVAPGNPRRFLRSAEWKKVRDDFFRGQLAAWTGINVRVSEASKTRCRCCYGGIH